MQILGKVKIQGIEKEILLKEDGEFFKYYTLELIGSCINKEIKNSHLDIKIIGEFYIEGIKREILLKKETKSLKYYYLNLIGVYTPKIPGETIIFRQDTLENIVLAEAKENIQKNNLTPLEKEQIKQFLEEIKIRDILKNISKKQNKEEKIVDNTNKLSDINIKQEIDMDTRVTDMKNLQQILQKNKKMPKLEHGDTPLKMGIVESDDLKKLKNEKGQKEQGQSDRYETVIITKKGKIHALHLENDKQEGTNSTEKNYQVKQNKTVQKGDVDTRLKIGEGTIGIERGQYGEVEVYHSPRKTIGGKNIEGNKSLDRQLETSQSKNPLEGTDIENLKLAQEYNDGYRTVEEGYQEVEKHKEQNLKCEPKSVKELDGDTNTVSHVHEMDDFIELSSGKKVSYNKLATRWGFYKDGKPDGDFVKEKLNEKKQENKKTEEIIQELDEEYEDPRTPERRI